MESPNLINIGTKVPLMGDRFIFFGGPGMLVREAIGGDERAQAVSVYDPASGKTSFPEPLCGVCGSPWPAAHQFCELCMYEKALTRAADQHSRDPF